MTLNHGLTLTGVDRHCYDINSFSQDVFKNALWFTHFALWY